MPRKIFLTLGLASIACALTVSACATPGSTSQQFPSAEDLRPEAKPVPAADVLDSEEAANAYEAALEAWGDRRDKAVARICRWAVNLGAQLPYKCPPPDG